MTRSLIKYLSIVFLIFSSFYYMYQNRSKLKTSIMRWQSFINSGNEFHLRVNCSYLNSKSDLSHIFLESLQLDQDEKNIFWIKKNGELEGCQANGEALILKQCKIQNDLFYCLEFQNNRVYFWGSDNDFILLARHFKNMPRKVREQF